MKKRLCQHFNNIEVIRQLVNNSSIPEDLSAYNLKSLSFYFFILYRNDSLMRLESVHHIKTR